jgi:hypothetical protein
MDQPVLPSGDPFGLSDRTQKREHFIRWGEIDLNVLVDNSFSAKFHHIFPSKEKRPVPEARAVFDVLG